MNRVETAHHCDSRQGALAENTEHTRRLYIRPVFLYADRQVAGEKNLDTQQDLTVFAPKTALAQSLSQWKSTARTSTFWSASKMSPNGASFHRSLTMFGYYSRRHTFGASHDGTIYMYLMRTTGRRVPAVDPVDPSSPVSLIHLYCRVALSHCVFLY